MRNDHLDHGDGEGDGEHRVGEGLHSRRCAHDAVPLVGVETERLFHIDAVARPRYARLVSGGRCSAKAAIVRPEK